LEDDCGEIAEISHYVEVLEKDLPGRARLVQLNNDNARETSVLTVEKFESMVAAARVATVINPGLAFLIAFDQDGDYDGAHFQWFRQRLDRFLYIDRVVVSGEHRRLGLGRLLYKDVIERAGRSDYPAIACEVNFQPPNPVSDAFHARFGFAEVGRGASDNGTKVVRYLVRRTGG
jgi:predicted GNAT superfamily acetyltransferase